MTRSPRRLSKRVREAVGDHVRDLPVQAAQLAMFGVGRALLLSDRVTKDYRELRESGPRPVLHRLRKDAQQLAGRTLSGVAERVSGSAEPTGSTEPSESPAARRPVAPAPKGPAARPPAARPPAAAARSTAAEPEIAVGKPAATRPDTTGTAPRPAAEPDRTGGAVPVAEPTTSKTPAPKARPAAKAAKGTVGAAGRSTARKATRAKAATSAESLPVPNYDDATMPSIRGRLRNLSADQIEQLRAYERKNAARSDVLRMYENRLAKLNEQRS